MSIYLTELDASDLQFPSPFQALEEPNGLLAFGGDLRPERILAAYRHGIFPWYGPHDPILWWSPAPRAVFNPKTFKPTKSLKKFQNKQQYLVTLNQATHQVIDQCAATRPAHQTWLNPEMRRAYQNIAEQGACHSVEVWDEHQQLIGGLYGLEVGQLFCGESMFSVRSNASKIALWYFCEHFQRHAGQLIDCQVMNPHLKSLGAIELPRPAFLQSLLSLREQRVDPDCYRPQELLLANQEPE